MEIDSRIIRHIKPFLYVHETQFTQPSTFDGPGSISVYSGVFNIQAILKFFADNPQPIPLFEIMKVFKTSEVSLHIILRYRPDVKIPRMIIPSHLFAYLNSCATPTSLSNVFKVSSLKDLYNGIMAYLSMQDIDYEMNTYTDVETIPKTMADYTQNNEAYLDDIVRVGTRHVLNDTLSSRWNNSTYQVKMTFTCKKTRQILFTITNGAVNCYWYLHINHITEAISCKFPTEFFMIITRNGIQTLAGQMCVLGGENISEETLREIADFVNIDAIMYHIASNTFNVNVSSTNESYSITLLTLSYSDFNMFYVEHDDTAMVYRRTNNIL